MKWPPVQKSNRWIGCWSLLGMLLLCPAVVFAQEQTLLVTYGGDARSIEGDADNTQVFFFEVPNTVTGPLFLRLYDADLGGQWDGVYGPNDTEHRFALYGGAGAFAPGVQVLTPDAEALAAGTLLQEARYGAAPALDNRWTTFARLQPSQGEPSANGHIFRFVVQGIRGNDANLFDVAVSTDSLLNAPPPGLRLFQFSPTIRLDRRGDLAELQFEVPPNTQAITAHNFDAGRATVTVETAYRSIRTPSSGQDEWAQETIVLEADEAAQTIALTFAGDGTETPNDATFYVADAAGQMLPMLLPIRRWRARNRRPEARVTVDALDDCVSFAFDASATRDADRDSLRFAWDFGDGTTGEGTTLRHRYGAPGRYDARLIVTDASGQIGNQTVERVPVIVNRKPNPEAGPDQVVAPNEVVQFDGSASTDPDGTILRYLWDFDDGSRGQGAVVTHRFRQPGRYPVKLQVEDEARAPCNFARDVVNVWVNAQPEADAGEDLSVAVGEPLRLNARASFDSDGEIEAYRWDFGDGTSGAGATTEHTFDTPGTFTVTLTVQDDAGVSNSTDADQITVLVNARPIAEAGPDQRVAIDELAQFDGSASRDPDGRIIGYNWDFGDNSERSGVRVSHAYRQAGRYVVALTVRDNSGSNSSTASDELVVIVNAPPVAEAGQDQLVTTSAVQFDARDSRDSDGGIATYTWDFGDGGTGTGASPIHIYRQPGTYRVRLVVSDDSGTIRNDDSDELLVVVNAAPIANAGADRAAAPGQTLRFDAGRSFDSDGEITLYAWDFGDGQRAEGRTATHAFAQPGTYTVRLSVRDDTGHPQAVGFDELVVRVNAPPVARAGADVLVAPGQPVTLDASASSDPDGRIAQYRWDFSDGASPIERATATRRFEQPGLYTARVTVTDASGTSNATDQDELTIHVNHAPTSVAGADRHVCEGLVRFDGSASADPDGHPLSYAWSFGDGTTGTGREVAHTYNRGGTYPVILNVDDGTGLNNATDVSDLSLRVNQRPIANAGSSVNVCAGEVTLLDGSRSSDPEGGLLKYRWDFGDSTYADEVNPTKTYREGGVYPVTLTIQDDSGLSCDTSQDRIVVTVAESPIARAGEDLRVCANKEVRFDGTASTDADGVVNRYLWDFNDGGTAGGPSPIHIFTEPGEYRVRLTIEGDVIGQCDNTDTDEVIVTVTDAPVAAFAMPERAPVGVPVALDASGSSSRSANITGYRWDFGDGTTGEGAQVQHVFAEAGSYIVTLTVETDGAEAGCTASTRQQTIIVNAPPVAEAGRARTVGVGEEVRLNGLASQDADGAVTSWNWSLGDGATAEGAEVQHRYARPGRYPAILTVTDDVAQPNSSDADTVFITVNAPPVPIVTAPAQACVAEDVVFSADRSTDADNASLQYRWTFGDGEAGTGAQAAHTYGTPGRYQVTLFADDGRNVANSQADTTQTLIVNRPPQAFAGPARRICAGANVAFDGSRSSDPDGTLTRFAWDFGDSGEAVGAQVTHAFARPGAYTARLTVTDDSGTQCATDTDEARIQVNTPPEANAGDDRSAFVGGAHDDVRFDASASRDADGDPLTYEWAFGDGGSATGPEVLHTFARPGTFTVTLTVRDGTGLPCGTTTDTVSVTVQAR